MAFGNRRLERRIADAAGIAHAVKHQAALLCGQRGDAWNDRFEFVVIRRLAERLGQRLNCLRRN